MGRRFGLFLSLSTRSRRYYGARNLEDYLESNLSHMMTDGWAEQSDGRFELTPEGESEARKFLVEVRRSGAFLRTMAEPQAVSLVTMVAHFLLAAIKLPAAILSNSVGLLNDAIDTLADGISSVLVFIGIRKGHEWLVSTILLIFMSVTGVLTAVEACRRLIQGAVPKSDPIAFAAIAVSAIICTGLWIYQRYIGSTRSSVPLIAQSIDSRNHVIVAAGVAIGLIVSALEVPYVDGAVGLIVSGLILKGAAEMLLELIRSKGQETPDLSAYGFNRWDQHLSRSLARWLLLQIDEGKITSTDDLKAYAHDSLDYRDIAALDALGIAEPGNRAKQAEDAVQRISDKEYASGKPLSLTLQGRKELDAALARRIRGKSEVPFWKFAGSVARIVQGAISIGASLMSAVAARLLLQYLPRQNILAGEKTAVSAFGITLTNSDVWLACTAILIFLGVILVLSLIHI